jgi:hypothetical protein
MFSFVLFYCMGTAGFGGLACSSIVGFLGSFTRVIFLLLATSVISSAGSLNWQMPHASAAFPIVRTNAIAAAARVPGRGFYYSGGMQGTRDHRGSLVVTPQWRSNQESLARGAAENTQQPRAIEPPSKDPAPAVALRPLSPTGQRTVPKSISPPPGSKPQAPSPAERSATAANINRKFQQAENKMGARPWGHPDRRNRLEQSRVFFITLIDDGYPLDLLDTWCDALLDDQVDTGMPMDLVDSYWGQPVSTQEYEEYYTPYQVFTYLTPDGNYRQVTFQNGLVAQAM